MTISMYSASVPALRRGLSALKGVLVKGKAFAAERGVEEAVLTNSRLFPDMLPFRAQVYIATDVAKFAAARLGELTAPSFEDNQESFDDLIARVDSTLEFLEGVKPEQLNGTEEKEVVMKRRKEEIKLTGLFYLTAHVLPNFYFHLSTAYGLLRQNGVSLDKIDYLGQKKE